jgi:hypothetical protein
LSADLVYGERRQIAGRDGDRCQGNFSASRMPISDDRVTDLVTICSEPGKDALIRYYAFVTARNGEGFLIINEQRVARLDTAWSANIALAVAAVNIATGWN